MQIARRAHSHGFTLLEILAAMVLLSLLMLGVWSGIRTATHTMHSGQKFVARTDTLRAAQDFMRRELTQASSQPWAAQDDGTGIVFSGTPDTIRYVAPLPGYLGKLGPQLQTLKLVSDGDQGYQLQVSFALLPPDGSKPRKLGEPQVLLSGIRNGRFSYRGRDDQRHPTDWLTRWSSPERVPALVRLDLQLKHGNWPQFITPVRVDSSAINGAGGLLRRILRPGEGSP